MSGTWTLNGTYFEACNCDAACPCVFLSAPTTGECTALVGWHVDDGDFGGVSLDGLNVVMGLHSPGHMAEVQWRVALYVDGRASEEQRNALTTIFGGQAGGHPAALASHVGEILGVSTASIDIHTDGKSRSLTIDDVARVSIVAIEGQGGADVKIENHPFAVTPGYPLTGARSTEFSYIDHGFQWDLSGKNGFFSPFRYAAS